ncbi:25296_t:CDS:2 [Gigaspora margarita]|uniref:25296_t:CDS:1 n=1 Tax=Gigaspora margarita TaxID=4874 RepID=A0ABN7V8N5_GIGMA|nr:25296_t:CDS:2 [Gigaspora margarita]
MDLIDNYLIEKFLDKRKKEVIQDLLEATSAQSKEAINKDIKLAETYIESQILLYHQNPEKTTSYLVGMIKPKFENGIEVGKETSIKYQKLIEVDDCGKIKLDRKKEVGDKKKTRRK